MASRMTWNGFEVEKIQLVVKDGMQMLFACVGDEKDQIGILDDNNFLFISKTQVSKPENTSTRAPVQSPGQREKQLVETISSR